jgi:hypothetical protein
VATIAVAAGKAPVLPVQVPSSVLTPMPEGNPYGLALLPAGFPNNGLAQPGDLLVSNFNNSSGKQGLGTTIDFIDPATGNTGQFFQVSGGETTGFTNALGAVKKGFIFAGTVLTTDGTEATAAAGDLYILNSAGNVVDTIAPDTEKVNGPWGLAINDLGERAQVFVSNVFDGTVTRLNVSFKGNSVTINDSTTIATGYSFGLNTGAIVVGPAGLFYDKSKDTLYVAAEDDNEIFAIEHAGGATTSVDKGALVFGNPALNGPLGLAMAPNGDLITVNADSVNGSPAIPSDVIEFTPNGSFVRQFSIDPNPGSGFAILPLQHSFAYVDDFTSNVTIWSH